MDCYTSVQVTLIEALTVLPKLNVKVELRTFRNCGILYRNKSLYTYNL